MSYRRQAVQGPVPPGRCAMLRYPVSGLYNRAFTAINRP